jgi:NADH dehydrogenase [ubiquinone] 1 alpha subcomplex assembly factor 5
MRGRGTRQLLLLGRRQFSVEVFDRQLKRRQRAYCLNQLKDADYYDYLREESARQLIDRLDDITRSFPKALELGSYRGSIYNLVNSRSSLQGEGGVGGIQHLVQCDFSLPQQLPPQQEDSLVKTDYMQVDDEFLPFKEDSFDLVLSSMHLHWINDLNSTLQQIRRCLKPDGAFIASFLGGDTLQELRHCLYMAENERKGGLSPHCSPLLRPSDLAALMQSNDFAMPTVDIEKVQIAYPDAFSLMEHLWRMGEGHATLNRAGTVGKDTFLAAAALYQGVQR